MIDNLMLIVKMLIALLPFLILCYLDRKKNLPKPERSKQFVMPIVAVLYVITVMLIIDPINDWIIKICNKLPQWISSLGQFSWMPEQVSAAFAQIVTDLKTIIQRMNLKFWVFFISNAVIMLLYLVIKKIILGITRKVIKPEGDLHSKVAGVFYDFYAEKNVWCIKNSFVQARILFRTFYYASIAISIALVLITRRFYYDNTIKTVFYPVFGVLIVGELFFYLDGATKREYRKEILGEDEDSYKITNYSLLKKYLRTVFGDKLVAENTSFNNELWSGMTVDELINELEQNDDPKINAFAEFANHLHRTGFKIDKNYLRSSIDMLNGKSVLFNDPFYEDLIPYAFYPMNRTLLRHKKVLVILGRHSIEDDIKAWIERGIESVTNMPFLWNIEVLGKEPKNADIGIMTRSQVFDISLHEENSEFLEDVGFVVIIEPSKLISTAQIGLNLLVKSFGWDDDVVYCISEKNCDGLVDAMSHILMTSITEVSATQKHKGTSSYMCWEADGEYLHHRVAPNISRYLGLGTELSFAALKNQVSKTKWFGGESFPVTDMHWIDRQYYYDLTHYASLPTGQDGVDEYFTTSANLWNAAAEENGYLIVEDEAFNMFEVLRDFSTRTTEQGFINVISSDYLLKDYMADNASIFETDAKAIPLIVADYTRSNRNTILKLALMMSTFPVSGELLSKELSLLGIRISDLKKQLWYELYSCYSSVSALADLPSDYADALDVVYKRSIRVKDSEWQSDIIQSGEKFNFKLGRMETVYSITDCSFLEVCISELKSASYITEDEKGFKYYLGSELSGQIYQRCLPGQFFSLGGKYYEMQYITADGNVLVRRAADHITGRPMYRQIRNYALRSVRSSERIGAQLNIAGLKVSKIFADITVSTAGYYQMERYNDFVTAQRILFEGESNGVPDRNYMNKEILCIELPEFDGKFSDNVRYTITVLLNEVFRTIFAENQAFVCAVTDDSFLDDSETCRPLTYSIKGEDCTLKSNAIYIIEDSQLDLGLTVAVERNLKRILEIVFDYLDWHQEALEESLAPQPEPQPHIAFVNEPKEEKEHSGGRVKNFFSAVKAKFKKFADKLKKLFKKSKDKPTPTEDETGVDNGDVPIAADEPIDDGERKENIPEENPDTGEERSDSAVETDAEEADDLPELQNETDEDAECDNTSDEQNLSQDEETVHDETDDFEVKPEETVEFSTDGDDEVNMPSQSELRDFGMKQAADERKPYHERYYMLFGRENEIPFIDLTGTYEYLSKMRLDNNPLKQARDGREKAESFAAMIDNENGECRQCDFCGSKIYGVEYETLSDGRERCMSCGRTAIKTVEDFRKIFDSVKKNMEALFGITINVGVRVEMVNSKTLHKRLGKAFIPTSKADARILGVAIKDRNGYALLIENGAPRMASMMTMVHELTHIWQYINWNEKKIAEKYGKKLLLEVYEGMAKWVEVQYAYLINEAPSAKREELSLMLRNDEYGRGYLRYRANYPLSLGTFITKQTPFMNIETPLLQEFCGEVSVDINSILPRGGFSVPESEKRKKKARGKVGDDVPFIEGLKERDPQNCPKYAFNLLDEGEKALYNRILEAINGFVPEIGDIDPQFKKDNVFKIVDYVLRDHPEVYWFRGSASVQCNADSEAVNKLCLTFCMSTEEAERRRKLIEKAEKSFMASVTDSMSDFEAALRVYENVIDLVDYDTLGLEKQKSLSGDADKPDDLRSIYGVFVNKKAVCAGYAKATQYLLNKLGIECTYVVSKTHAWNLVKLEGDYYHLDTTWGDSSNTKKSMSNSGRIGYNYFCITTEELLKIDEHIPTEDLPLPICTAEKCNYFRRLGLYFDKYDYERIKEITCKSIRAGKKSIAFKFASCEEYDTAYSCLIDEGHFREILQYSNLEPGMRVDTGFAYCCDDKTLTIEFMLKLI